MCAIGPGKQGVVVRIGRVKIGLIGAGCALVAATYASQGKSALNFTREPLAAQANNEARAVASTVLVALPVDLHGIRSRADELFPPRLAKVVETLPNASCANGLHGWSCTAAKVEGDITRSGPTEIEAKNGAVLIRLPLSYQFSARGTGWTNHLNEQKSGTLVLNVALEADLGTGFALEPVAREEIAGDLAITLLRGSVNIAKLLEPKIKELQKAAIEDLRQALSTLRIKAAAARAWSALSQPLELGTGSGLWLRAEPVRVIGAGFAIDEGRLSYRLAVPTRMALIEGDEPAAPPLRQPSQGHDAAAAKGVSRLLLPVLLDLEPMRRMVEAQLVQETAIETRGDRFSEAVTVAVRSTSMYPVFRQVALELDLEVTGPKAAAGYSGKAYLVGQPVYKPESMTVALEDVTFPMITSKETSSDRLAAGAPRIGVEPFASKLSSGRIDVARPVQDALPRINHVLNLRLADDLVFRARFREVAGGTVETAPDGVYLMLDLQGELVLWFEGDGGA
jgi:Domain of unknown function (DUF4403)